MGYWATHAIVESLALKSDDDASQDPCVTDLELERGGGDKILSHLA